MIKFKDFERRGYLRDGLKNATEDINIWLNAQEVDLISIETIYDTTITGTEFESVRVWYKE